jgi:hypothetical protein
VHEWQLVSVHLHARGIASTEVLPLHTPENGIYVVVVVLTVAVMVVAVAVVMVVVVEVEVVEVVVVVVVVVEVVVHGTTSCPIDTAATAAATTESMDSQVTSLTSWDELATWLKKGEPVVGEMTIRVTCDVIGEQKGLNTKCQQPVEIGSHLKGALVEAQPAAMLSMRAPPSHIEPKRHQRKTMTTYFGHVRHRKFNLCLLLVQRDAFSVEARFKVATARNVNIREGMLLDHTNDRASISDVMNSNNTGRGGGAA